MGKSKEDHKLKRSSSSPRHGDDESRSKRRRSKDDDKEDKSSKKLKSGDSSKKHSHKDKKSSSKRKNKGHKLDKLTFQELTDEDYFSKNNEFSTWLKEEKRKFFADLSSDAARSLFSEFVSEWNNQNLDAQYYTGIASGPRTSHKWNIRN